VRGQETERTVAKTSKKEKKDSRSKRREYPSPEVKELSSLEKQKKLSLAMWVCKIGSRRKTDDLGEGGETLLYAASE